VPRNELNENQEIYKLFILISPIEAYIRGTRKKVIFKTCRKQILLFCPHATGNSCWFSLSFQ